jgi:exodeoxyribonuclease V alpha subunit
MRIEQITGKPIVERQRWAGDPYDTLILTVSDGDDEWTVKVRESDWGLSLRHEYTFWGNWSSYKNRHSGRMERQLSAFAYYDAEFTREVVDVMELLLGQGFPRDLAAQAVDQFGGNARRLIETNPYILGQFDRVGFKLCDKLYIGLGKPESRLKRQTLCAAYALREDTSGSIWHPQQRVQSAISGAIGGFEGEPARAIRLGVRAGLLSVMHTDGHQGPPGWDGSYQWVASGRLARTERELADYLREFSSASNRWPDVAVWDEGEHQHAQLKKATSSPIGILLGGAGTGKTFTAAKLIKSLLKDSKHLAIAAPTGKAAVRLTESLAEIGVQQRAVTLHSLMGYDGSRFRKPICDDYLIVDESSMVDQQLMHAIFANARPGLHVLFLGDPYQLPPVGAGAPLRDMTELIPCGTLTEVRRNAGAIVQAGAAIRDGKRIVAYRDRNKHDNLISIQTNDPRKQILAALECHQQLVDEEDLDPLWDIQILGIVNQRSPVGCHSLNKTFQHALNPNAEEVPGSPFRVGDKVMQTRNGWMIPARGKLANIHPDAVLNDAGQVYCANGEMGQVLAIDDKSMTIAMIAPPRVVVSYRKDVDDESEESVTGSSYQLAYAITTHKSQGSQFPYTIFMIDDYAGARRLFDRSLLYTGITRSKRATFLVGDLELAQAAISRASVWNRKTFLKEIYHGDA